MNEGIAFRVMRFTQWFYPRIIGGSIVIFRWTVLMFVSFFCFFYLVQYFVSVNNFCSWACDLALCLCLNISVAVLIWLPFCTVNAQELEN